MAAYFLCLTAGGGVPLFYRSRGNLKPLPFPIIGSLNGVHMFASTHGVKLIATTTDTAKVVWKVYNNSLTLIIVSRGDHATDGHLTQLLDFIFQSMVLLYGLDDLTNIKNIERFKREIKVCYKMVDCLLEQSEGPTCGHIVNAADVIAAPENNILQAYLDAFIEAANSPYGCLIVNGRVAVATHKWWELTALELVLLPLLIRSLPPCSSRDVPVFLPVGSPKVPHRLLTFQLTEGIEVCTLCGPTPSLADLEREVGRFWRSSLDSLKSLSAQQPRVFPASLHIDANILGFIVINTESHRCLYSVQPVDEANKKSDFLAMTPSFVPMSMWAMPAIPEASEDVPSLLSYKPHGNGPAFMLPPTKKTLSPTERRRILCSFYRTVVGKLWKLPASDTDTEEVPSSGDLERFSHDVQDTYVCADTHKCYAMRNGPHQLLVLFNSTVPTYAMRSVCSKTLQAFLHDKSVQL